MIRCEEKWNPYSSFTYRTVSSMGIIAIFCFWFYLVPNFSIWAWARFGKWHLGIRVHFRIRMLIGVKPWISDSEWASPLLLRSESKSKVESSSAIFIVECSESESSLMADYPGHTLPVLSLMCLQKAVRPSSSSQFGQTLRTASDMINSSGPHLLRLLNLCMTVTG